MFVCCECCVLSGRGLCDELITRPEESYRLWCVIVCDLENLKNEEAMTRVGSQRHQKKNNTVQLPPGGNPIAVKYIISYIGSVFYLTPICCHFLSPPILCLCSPLIWPPICGQNSSSKWHTLLATQKIDGHWFRGKTYIFQHILSMQDIPDLPPTFPCTRYAGAWVGGKP